MSRHGHNVSTVLIFNRKMGQCCTIKCTSLSSERETTVAQWTFKLNSTPAVAETLHLKGHMLKAE